MGPAIPLAAGHEVVRVEARFGHYDGRWYGGIPSLPGCMVEDKPSEKDARDALLSLLCRFVTEYRNQAKPIPWLDPKDIPPANWDETTRIFAVA